MGNLWAADGTPLATATFTNETATGWQQVDFRDTGGDQRQYRLRGVLPCAEWRLCGQRPPTSPRQDSTIRRSMPWRMAKAGAMACICYGPGGFPNQSYNASNYWVDVVFTDTTGPDTTPPAVTSTAPSDGATNVAIGTAVTATFSEALDPATITTATFELRDAGDIPVQRR